MSAKKAKRLIFITALLIIGLIWVVPVLSVVFTSIKSKQDFFSGMGLFELPKNPAFSNYVKAVKTGNLFRYMKNGLIISCLKVPLGIFVESLAAFALTRTKIKHSTGLFIFLLAGMMLPMQVALVPINVIFHKLGLINTYFGLFYVYIGFGLSYGILILRGFMRGIPKEMDEAAIIDGCTKWQLYTKIIMPMAMPAVATLVITDFLATWNEYLLASVIINDNLKKTIPVGLMTFVGEHSTDYGLLCAGVVICIVPVLTVYLIFQRHFVEGMSGAVKS